MDNKIPAFVFRNRPVFSVGVLVASIILKCCLHGTTSLLLYIIGLVIVVVGILFRMCSIGYLLGKHTVAKLEANFLCTSGPFAYIRNPL